MDTAKNKMTEPYFKMLWSEDIAKEELVSNGGKVMIEIISGSINGKTSPTPPPHSWANNVDNDVAIWNIKMDERTEWVLPQTHASTNRTLYFYEGEDLSANDEIFRSTQQFFWTTYSTLKQKQ